MIQILVAVAMGVAIIALGVWSVRFLMSASPGEPDPDDLVEVHQDYRCSVCGMRLTVTGVTGDELEAPRHCREQMEAV